MISGQSMNIVATSVLGNADDVISDFYMTVSWAVLMCTQCHRYEDGSQIKNVLLKTREAAAAVN